MTAINFFEDKWQANEAAADYIARLWNERYATANTRSIPMKHGSGWLVVVEQYSEEEWWIIEYLPSGFAAGKLMYQLMRGE